MKAVDDELTRRIVRDGFSDGYVGYVNEVTEAVNKLDMNKRDGSNSLSTSNFKFACTSSVNVPLF
jgi:hypothetical protein